MVHAFNSRIQEAEAGDFKFEAIQGYIVRTVPLSPPPPKGNVQEEHSVKFLSTFIFVLKICGLLKLVPDSTRKV